MKKSRKNGKKPSSLRIAKLVGGKTEPKLTSEIIRDMKNTPIDIHNPDIEDGWEWLVLKKRSERSRRIRHQKPADQDLKPA